MSDGKKRWAEDMEEAAEIAAAKKKLESAKKKVKAIDRDFAKKVMSYRETVQKFKKAYWETLIKNHLGGAMGPGVYRVWVSSIAHESGMKYAACRRHLILHGYTIKKGSIQINIV